MRLDGNERDIIIVTGCNAVGKTTASNYLRELSASHHVPCEDKIIADSQCLFEAMQSDDREGGSHHAHDWCEKDSKGHTHHLNQPLFPFTVTDNELPDIMRLQFFSQLAKLPKSGNLWFVEWAAGVNTNSREDPASCIDYSYAKVKSMLQEGSLPDGWLSRVEAVIHLEAHYDVRLRLNAQRSIPGFAQPEALEQGTAFWRKDEKVLRFYGRDDFSAIENLFRKANIPVYPIENDGNGYFYKRLETVANELFSSEKVASAQLSYSS